MAKKRWYSEGYAQCARDVLERLEGLWTHRTRELCPKSTLDWLKSMSVGDPYVQPEPEPAENARVEGEDVA